MFVFGLHRRRLLVIWVWLICFINLVELHRYVVCYCVQFNLHRMYFLDCTGGITLTTLMLGVVSVM